MKTILFLLFFTSSLQLISSQNNQDVSYRIKIQGTVSDATTKEPLPYVNIFEVRTYDGIISNEQGRYAPAELNAVPDDTICFRHIGYKTKRIPLRILLRHPDVYLESNTFNISEVTVFPDKFDPRSIVEKVLQNKALNYKAITSEQKVFVRQRSVTDFNDFDIDLRKRTAEPIKQIAKNINTMMNRKFISYTDFTGTYYTTADKEDTVKTKLESTDALRLNPDMNALNLVADSITNLSFLDVDTKEYWKMRTGIIGIELKDDRKSVPRDTVKKTRLNDSLGREPLVLLLKNINFNLGYTGFSDKDLWQFLYDPGKYNFKLEGGTVIGNEYAYIISFTPKKRGLYKGRMYITSDTYALLRADYEYAPGKTGKSIQLLGVGYTENMFKASIYFEKNGDNYRLKQFSKQSDIHVTINRPLAFIKKRERRLFNKTLEDIKSNLTIEFTENESFEFFVIEEKNISEQDYRDVKQDIYYNVNYTGSVNSDSWSDFAKIVPAEL
ncbi:carboxypeptidase-like regulatory domain-containing protein [Saccharicrinis sp. FJH54]|uniref:carboxypeptidase-like regulatory domain-containing protein n=1 Tax=Saccharicrinis sp. FJH54 TaxID=3344665 RepID=UPI0035D4C216